MGTLLNRRRVMGGGGSDIVLPEGYTKLDELSVTSGNYYVDTGIVSTLNVTVRIVSQIKYHTVASNLRQYSGYNYAPFFACNYGKFVSSGNLASTPARNTVLDADVWYDLDVSYVITVSSKIGGHILIFAIANHTGDSRIVPISQYQSYMSVRPWLMYEDNVLVRHLVPCLSPENNEGMYDIVTNTFYQKTSY